MDRPFIVISVFGGFVQDVFCSIPDALILLVDWDQDPDPAFDREDIVHGQNNCSALVGSFDAKPLDDLNGTDDETAIMAAHEKGLIDESPFVVS